MNSQLLHCRRFFKNNLPVLIVIVMYIAAYKLYVTMNIHKTDPHEKIDKLTIRVNTFRRLDLLEDFMDYYKKCDVVDQVQVVWSDQEQKAPITWLKDLPTNKFIFEIHNTNSLSNRFRPLVPINTEAVLSIDDDLIIPCQDLYNSLQVWKSNKRALVGFSPRMHAHDINTSRLKYLNWQYTWWSGLYSIVLTKASILHKDYLSDYDVVLPKSVIEHIDQVKNCEDLAMAYVIALKSKSAPVWVKATVYEVSTGGISSQASHFIDRGTCLSQLKALTTEWPWVTGYQKVVGFSVMDWFKVFSDTK